MMYEVVMPQLSDSMDEGKLISWKVSVGDSVKSGDVIAEVESDKAVMEVQTFKDGLVKELLVKEGEEAKVGAVMAKIETDAKESTPLIKKVEKKSEKKIEEKQEEKVVKKETQAPKEGSIFDDIFHIDTEEETKTAKPKHIEQKSDAQISPKARAKAAAYGVDISDVVKKSKDKIVHVQDVDNYFNAKYFTAKAIALLEEYQIDSSCFELNHKIDSDEVKKYIQEHDIALPKSLTQMQKAIIANVTASAVKPIFHIYENVDVSLLEEHKESSISVWFIKIVAKVMMNHEVFRSELLDNAIRVEPNASISLAVADDKNLYMSVIKDANRLSVNAIKDELQNFKSKLKKRSFIAADMQGATFGISNLGMLGVERFDAMINRNESAILAIGTIIEGKISITLTADHRLINGYEAALFMQDIKKEMQNPFNFKINK